MVTDNRLIRNTVIFLLVLLAIPLVGMLVMIAAGAFAHGGMMSGAMGGMMGGTGGIMNGRMTGMMAVFGAWGLLFTGALIYLIVLLVRAPTHA